ncbi:MAG: flagellar hook-basal body complex protein FliE [Desulfobulbus sp.]|nr:flagellar hook-basal body complex protein FliE [Desulfobulbus sp.]
MEILQALTAAPLAVTQPTGSVTSQVESSFGDMLSSMVNQTNQLQQQADQAVEQLHAGGEQNLHEAMISMEKADISLRYTVQVRNKAIDAYQEVMRMQV